MSTSSESCNLPPAQLVHGIRETNAAPQLGVQSLKIAQSCDVGQDDVLTFLRWAGELVAECGAFDAPLQLETVNAVQGSEVRWSRSRYRLYPLYLNHLEITREAATASEGAPPGVRAPEPDSWMLDPEIFAQGELNYLRHRAAWRQFIERLVREESAPGGLAFNVIEVPAASLKSGSIDVHPLVLHALAPDGTACDRSNTASQAAIANAFWQTFWATGALRAQRGKTFPVAFVPVDRTWPGEFTGCWHHRWISLHRKIFGRTSLLAWMCEALTGARALWFDTTEGQFVVADTFDPSASGLQWGDYNLCLFELNRTAFVDAYTGDNANMFTQWRAQESDPSTQPQPWSDDLSQSPGDGPAEAYVRSHTAAEGGRFVRIHRVVPYSGCAFLSEVVNETERLRSCGKIRDLDDEILGATNSTFFLNFPEEYATLHSAMNDPVAALVEGGRVHQIRTLRRAAFVLTQDGRPFITTSVGLKLNCPALVFEGESVAATSFRNADRPFSENRVGPLTFGAVVVGSAIVETFEDTFTEVPANGWVIGDSEAFTDEFEPADAAGVEFRDPATGAPMPLRHVFAVGPLLVAEGDIVPLGHSKEEFMPIEVRSVPSFEESAELPRTALPAGLRQAPRRGVPPTRFPWDWTRTRAPRTAIGIRDDGAVLLVVVDGRANLAHSGGATLAELAQLMKNMGCHSAMNMDGGGSSVMFVNDPAAREKKLAEDLRPGVVNLPSDLGGVERLLPVPLVITRRTKG
jgi:hypothetical protein